MSTLRTKMTQDMIVRGLAKSTQNAYLHAVTELSAYYDHRNPATLSSKNCSITCCTSARNAV